MRTRSERPRASSNPDIDVVAIIHSAGRTHALPQLAKRLVFSGGWLGIRSLMPLSLLPTGDRIVGADRGAVGSMRWAFFLIARRVRSRRLFRVAVSVTSFLLLNEVLRTTDLIAIVPQRLLTGVDGLTMMKPPIDIPGFDKIAVWHERTHYDPGHQWARKLLFECCSEMEPISEAR